jgi:hypothetical protein
MYSRFLLFLAFTACPLLARPAAADPPAAGYTLRPAAGLASVRQRVQVDGQVTVKDGDEVRPLAMQVAGQFQYDQRALQRDPARTRAVRFYRQAEAAITVGGQRLAPRLAEANRLVALDADAQTALLFAPQGGLTHEQLDLIDLPGDPLLAERLLPSQAVAIGDTWTHGNDVWAALLRLDAVGASDVRSTLREVVERRTARVELAGNVDGAIDGVATHIELRGRYHFDLAEGRITALGLLIREQRPMSHCGPGLDVTARLETTLAPLADCDELGDAALADLPLDRASADLTLAYDGPAGAYRLHADRRWQIVDERPEMTVLRLVDRGELVAQCNVAPAKAAESGQMMALSRFQSDIQQALGENFGQFLSAATEQTPDGATRYRVEAAGRVSELAIRWVYYLVADRQGRQIVFAFTLDEGVLVRFAEADRALVESFEFLAQDRPAPASAGRPAAPR